MPAGNERRYRLLGIAAPQIRSARHRGILDFGSGLSHGPVETWNVSSRWTSTEFIPIIESPDWEINRDLRSYVSRTVSRENWYSKLGGIDIPARCTIVSLRGGICFEYRGSFFSLLNTNFSDHRGRVSTNLWTERYLQHIRLRVWEKLSHVQSSSFLTNSRDVLPSAAVDLFKNSSQSLRIKFPRVHNRRFERLGRTRASCNPYFCITPSVLLQIMAH